MTKYVGSLTDTRILATKDIRTPRQLKQELPLTDKVAEVIGAARSDIVRILNGEGHGIVLMVGPCSIHHYGQAYHYAQKLAPLAKATRGNLLILMRVYFEKPRTRLGWKGFINDPHLDETNNLDDGLFLARKLLLDINALGLPVVTEFLDPIVPQYIGDLISTGTIGARTTESQTHREMASGLSMPVGFKNGTDGSVDVALDALVASRGKHSFLGINEDGEIKRFQTTGNPDGYIMLRGGRGTTNFDEESIGKVVSQVEAQRLGCRLVVDCSHGNSHKKHVNQATAFHSVLKQISRGNRHIAGMMLESNLLPGRQDYKLGVVPQYGVSITDECISWEETGHLITEAHRML